MATPVYGNIYLLTREEAEHLELPQVTDMLPPRDVSYSKVREAGPLRSIVRGPARVAQAPSEDDWQQAAEYVISIDTAAQARQGALLSIEYRGDCARLYAGDRLVADNFQYGRPFLYGLWRMPQDADKLRLLILPMQEGAPIYLPREADHSAGEGIKSIRIIASK